MSRPSLAKTAKAFPHSTLALIFSVTLLFILLFTNLVDYAVWLDNQAIDGVKGFSEYEFERYKVQVVEVHILGVGFALAIQMTLLALWLKGVLER